MNTIVDHIRAVVEAMQVALAPVPALDPDDPGAGAPYFMAGHRMEIAKRLTEKGLDRVFQKQKYPLIALRLDAAEKVSGDVINYTLNLAIITYNHEKYNAEERMENVFKPTLIPLYEEFFEQLRNVGLFTWPNGQDKPEHTKILRPFWGIQETEGNRKNIFNDPIDAIEIIDLKVNRIIDNCDD